MNIERALVMVLLGVASAVSIAFSPGCAAARTAGDPGTQPTLIRHEYARVLMGSKCRIVLYASHEPDAAEACAAAFARVSHLNDVLSDYSPDSEASRVIRAEPGEWHPISQDLYNAIDHSVRASKATDGAFDATLGPLTRLWRETRRSGALPPQGVLEAALARSGWGLIELDPDGQRLRFGAAGMGLDFGGIGKGIAADEALAVLAERGYPRAMIDFGGDLRLGDPPPDSPEGWAVEIRDGLSGGRTIRLANAAVATSGDAERSVTIGGVTYSHVLNPMTGLGLRQRRAATVVAPEGWLADAMASAACVVGPGEIPSIKDAFPGIRVWVSEVDGDF